MSQQGAAIIPAAGSGSRMKSSCPKQYLEICGKPILVHTVSAFYSLDEIGLIIVVVPHSWVADTRDMLKVWQLDDKTEVIAGGVLRQDSVKRGLEQLNHRSNIVLVHDGARPLVSSSLIRRCLEETAKHGAAIAAIPVKDTLKKGNGRKTIESTIDRTDLWQAQTPQGARVSLLEDAYANAGRQEFTDEASLLESIGCNVKLVEGSETNIKITRPEDFDIAEKIMSKAEMNTFRIGHGYDAHQLAHGRALVLAGVAIEHSTGLEGHSDADVATHALCDAILGALGKGDIGKHFPDTSLEFKDIYSILLLEKVVQAMESEKYTIGNADITIICQSPKLAPHIPKMQKIIAETCHVSVQQINIKATTTEKMGFTGREEGISSHAVVFLSKILN